MSKCSPGAMVVGGIGILFVYYVVYFYSNTVPFRQEPDAVFNNYAAVGLPATFKVSFVGKAPERKITYRWETDSPSINLSDAQGSSSCTIVVPNIDHFELICVPTYLDGRPVCTKHRLSWDVRTAPELFD